ncbi:DUF1749-domain-containing protein [Polychaeton citri CBS 116435]|uniref:DUF1749-domain-containing protein n=1 Tax=Polychaeton citri CBS 116435 TaxID=1314669 RepID=A0A9P4UP06_9PEZI|nr:DUF1749-domain-containing protein [Polychaeton citri CBS 116435]
MYSKFWAKGGIPGVLHHYTETHVAFEFTSSSASKPHSILFIGGLGDGLATTSYMSSLGEALQLTPWSLFTINLTSSYQSWGVGHLDRDIDEIAKCAGYIKEYKATKYGISKLVLMGHSTGSQDVLHYLYRPNPHVSVPPFDPWLEHIKRPVIDGAIMQAPVSDREALHLVMEEGIFGNSGKECRRVFDKLVALAKEDAEGDQTYQALLPISLTSQLGYPSDTPVSCRRFLSLASPDSPEHPQEDDLFSTDLSTEQLEKTFGKVREQGLLRGKILVLSSGADQSVPPNVDKARKLARWQEVLDHHGETRFWDEEFSGVIPNASHALSNDDQVEPRRDLCARVLGFLQKVENA